MDINSFCRDLPKIELHAHLNGSLSQATMLELKRYYVNAGFQDDTNIFFDQFQIAAGDDKSLSDCFEVFKIAHGLTTTPEALAIATTLTLQEFQDDGCCYIELRSSPRETPYMSRKKYIETIVHTLEKSVDHFTIISRLIISIDRRIPLSAMKDITELAIEYYISYPNIVCGIEISGDPSVGEFKDFAPFLERARNAGMKVTLHCGEICNPEDVLAMLKFRPERIGHGICIHPNYGGTDLTWSTLCDAKTPVEVCLTSNVRTKSTADYESHHFKKLLEADIPVIICTDDKGVFATSLSQEYRLCAETFKLSASELALLSLKSCQYIFADEARKTVCDTVQKFIDDKGININL